METSRPLELYFIPYLARGHLIPLVHLARLVASRGHQVTIVTTPSNAEPFHKTIEDDRAAYGHVINVHFIKFPSHQVGLPAGMENFFDANDNQTAIKMDMAAQLLQQETEAFMKQSPPDFFIVDIKFSWSEASSKRLGIPRLIFNPLSMFVVCICMAVKNNHLETTLTASDSESDSGSGPYQYHHITGLPHPITLPFKPSPAFGRLAESLVEAEKDSLGVIVNSFPELEGEYAQHYEKLTGRKVWMIGPTSLMVQNTLPISTVQQGGEGDGDNSNKHGECIMSWLNSKERDSVIYISFGSMCRLSDEQLFEIATGIEASGHQFLWVVHRKNKQEEEKKWLPQGFEESMRKQNRGMIIEGWVPQPLILNHPAVGGFLTQCGWNAIGEAISAGVPMITMPGFGDQYYLEKLISEVRGFGVEVGAVEWTMSPYDAKKKVVSGESIERALKRLMDGGKEGEAVRSEVEELKDKAWKAVQDGGSSHNSLTDLIHHLHGLLPNT